MRCSDTARSTTDCEQTTTHPLRRIERFLSRIDQTEQLVDVVLGQAEKILELAEGKCRPLGFTTVPPPDFPPLFPLVRRDRVPRSRVPLYHDSPLLVFRREIYERAVQVRRDSQPAEQMLQRTPPRWRLCILILRPRPRILPSLGGLPLHDVVDLPPRLLVTPRRATPVLQ